MRKALVKPPHFVATEPYCARIIGVSEYGRRDLMSSTGYGRALYYPYIHLQDANWIKVAALYYDKLLRIVPEGFKTQDKEIVRLLNDKFQFIENLHPEKEAQDIAMGFLRFAEEELSDPKKRKEFTTKIGTLLPTDSRFPLQIHEAKIAQILQAGLLGIGLAKKSQYRRPWYDFEPVTGALYMTYLANEMAEKRGLPIVTDDPVYQPLIRGIQQVRSRLKREDTGHALASLVIKTAIPRDIRAVSVQKIIEFRRKHDDERHRFYVAMRGLAKDIPTIQDPDALSDCLNHHKKTVDEAVKDLKLSFRDVGIGIASGLFGLSLPSWVSNLARMEPGLGVQVFSAGVACVGIGVLIKKGSNIYESRQRSPWSYVLSLKHELRPDGFIRKLLKGAKIL
jgi:hypothetical protein